MCKQIIIVLILVSANFGVVFAQSDKFLDRAVVDRVGLLNSNEISKLVDDIHRLERQYQISMGIYFMDTLGGYQIGSVADALVKQNFSSAQNGGIVFVVDMETRKWWISTDSRMKQRIPDVYAIANSGVLDNLSGGNYYGAAASYVNAVNDLLNYYEQRGTAYDTSDEFNPAALMAAIVMAIFFGVAIRSWLIGSMSNVQHKAAASDYLKRDSIKLTTNRDTYLFTRTERRAKAQASRGNSGGGHGGSSGGGGGGSF